MLTQDEISKNMDICDHGYRRAKLEGYDGVKIDCFNKEEAEWVKKYWNEHYPDIPCQVTWLEFGARRDIEINKSDEHPS